MALDTYPAAPEASQLQEGKRDSTHLCGEYRMLTYLCFCTDLFQPAPKYISHLIAFIAIFDISHLHQTRLFLTDGFHQI